MSIERATWPSITGGRITQVCPVIEDEREPAYLLVFFVAGTPRSAGSKRIFRRRDGGLNVTHDGIYTAEWMQTVAGEALKARCEAGLPVLTSGVEVTATFSFQRPRNQFRRDGTVYPEAPALPTSYRVPDLDKLARALLDGLAGIIYIDDHQVVRLTLSKQWGEEEGVLVEVRKAGAR